jgi:DNA transformation protein and related proteins
MSTRKLRSLNSSESFRQFVLDQLEPLDVRAQSMFGGTGLYSGEYFFGIVARDRLFLKVDSTTRARYTAAKMKPFRPYADRPGTMQYYEVPVSVVESGAELEHWAREAVSVARRAAAARSAPRVRPKTSTGRASRARTRR